MVRLSRRTVVAQAVAFALLATSTGAQGQAPVDASSAAPTSAPVDAALSRLVDQLGSVDRNMRRAAASSIDTLGPSATPALAAELARLRAGRPPGEIAAVLARARPAADAGDRTDRLDALLDVSPDAAGPAYAQTVATLAIVRALDHIASPEAIAALAPVALDARGAFAPLVKQLLADLGERAIAGLVLMSGSRSAPANRWATSELEALGKRTPGDAVQTKDKQVLADVLLAYGTVHDADALPVVMSFVNADHRIVRDAAREALVRYGDGAALKLRESYGLLTGDAAPVDWPTPWLRRKLFEALDRVRCEDVDAKVSHGLDLARDGRFAEAVEAFDAVLARQPDLDRQRDLVPAYVFRAQELVGEDPGHARELLGRALRLDPSGPRSGQIQGEIALLDGRDLVRRGVLDEEPFRRALAFDPSNAAAAAELWRLQEDRRTRHRLWTWRAAAVGTGLAAICTAILFVGGGRRRRRGRA